MADDFHGAVWWSELMTRDPDAALAYYAEVCGWRFDSMEMEGSDSPYHVAMRGDRPVAGIMDMTAMPELDEAPAHWFTYVAVADVDAAVAATRAAGGEVMRPPFEVAGVGRIAIVADPTGAALGLMTPAQGEGCDAPGADGAA